MKRVLAALALLALVLPAQAQSVIQSGSVSRGHLPYWTTNGVIADGGTSADSPVSSIGATGSICSNSARISSGSWLNLCLGYTGGIPTISVQNNGSATAQPLQFVVNGTTYAFPGSLTNITIGTTPVVGGTNSLCLFVSAGVVGQQACTLSAITSLTGDVTGTGPGVTATTLATVNANVGTFGSGALVPIITVNGKGLITAVSTTSLALAVGSTTIASGSTNGLLYNNGAVLGNLGTLASGVLITSAGGIPSIATTLPSGLTIPSPTFTGTETFPDAATWTATGISKVAALSVGSATLPSAGNVSISGQYQINGTQISATSALSDGKTGTGSLVGAASPAISGTWTGNAAFSGNITHSGQLIATGTSAPASAGGNTVVMGTIAAPTLSNNGQAFLYNTVVGGAILEGAGSTSDISLFNKSAAAVFTVPTGTTKLNFPSLSSGTCSSGLGLDSGNNTVLVSCPGAAGSVQVGTTVVNTAAGTNRLLTEGPVSGGAGVLADVPATIDSSGNLAAVNSIAGSVIASKAQQQTATSGTNVVTPLHQQDHPSAAKVWVNFVGSSGSINSSYNIASVTRNSAGNYSLAFTTSFSTANYSCESGTMGAGGSFTTGVFNSSNVTAGGINLLTYNSSFSATDPVTVMVTCHGTQ